MSPTNSVLRFAKLSENAFAPMKESAFAAGFDLRRFVYNMFYLFIHSIILFSAYDYIVPARGRVTALTDIQIAVPLGCYGRVGQYLFVCSRKNNDSII